ncbi:hypothetical protein [Wolbachia pipientis]|uniref:hypothetical protein n=1 Tax=Wolbachia pipientis TaxID=955 RepID=UPI0025A3E3A7|nr:hypothetical protein [Wolbachia pipientis]MDM8335074.1 hypothetical protein [Wolbachia pipientis]
MTDIKETLRALVSVFNVYNYARDTVETNFKLEDRGGKNYITVSFDKGIDEYQCVEYLRDIKRKIIGEFYCIKEESTDEAVLNTAKLIFDVESFPFSLNKGELLGDEYRGFKFVTPIDTGVIHNLKSHLASSLKKDVLEGMKISSETVAFNKEKYLCHDEFPSSKLRKQFEREFSLKVKKRYKNVPKKLLKVKGNGIYIRNVLDDVRFIDSITQYVAWLIGMDLGVSNSVDYKVKLFKNMIIESIDQLTGVVIDGFICASPLNRKEASVLIPVIQGHKGIRFMTKEEARTINSAFNNIILNDTSGRTQAELSVNGNNAIYGIDFSNSEISYCVITKIIENSVINKKHELSIGPEFRFQPLSQLPLPKEMIPTQLESPRRESGLLFLLQNNVGSIHQSQLSTGMAAVNAESKQVACEGSLSLIFGEGNLEKSSSEHFKAKFDEDRVSNKSESKSLKEHGTYKIQVHVPYQPPSNGSGVALQATGSSNAEVDNLALSINSDVTPISPLKSSLSSYMLCKSWPTRSHRPSGSCNKLSEIRVIQVIQQHSKGAIPKNVRPFRYVDEAVRKRQKANKENKQVYQ